jgi:flagellar L-ring protein FlgH
VAVERGVLTIRCLAVFSVVAVAMLLTGCVHDTELVKHDSPQPEVSAPAPKPPPGTIWAGENTASMLFTDRKARYVGDIVTILISEAAVGDNNATTDTSRDSSAYAGIDAFLGIDQSILSRNANMGGKIEIGGTASNALKGAGSTSREGKLEGKLTAQVVKVFGNGNMLIEGRRQVTVNAEDQYIIITGIIRPDDITSSNTIYSPYIADARIIYTGRGVVNDKMRPGWMTRVLDWVWPF